MKTSPIFCRAIVILCLLTCIDLSAFNTGPADTVTNYVIIGAFSSEHNAKRFVVHATNDLHLQAKVDLNPARNLYYVYSLTTSNKREAFAEARRLRKETELQDAWVFRGMLGATLTKDNDIDPVNEEVMTSVPVAEEEVAADSAAAEPVVLIETVTIEDLEPVEDVGTGKAFYFKLTRIDDQQEVAGTIDIIDPDKARKLDSYESNKRVVIPNVKNTSGKITAVADAFGYRKMQVDLNYTTPEADTAVAVDNVRGVVVPMELVRLKKGDFAIMYNVFFFRDAAIMRPESKFEVNNLVDMMKENPKCIIRIHGHTNGNHAGKIIYQGAGSTNFFSLDGSRDGFGSAKELSGARAEAIKNYLVSQGVEESRLMTKAWGGKKAIHKKNSPRAAENVRVEVEIVQD